MIPAVRSWTRDEMMKRVAFFKDLKGSKTGLPDSDLPECEYPQPNDLLSFGPFSLLTAERLLKKADESIPLGGRALDILSALVERAGEVVTHRELISTVWPGVTVEDANLRAQIAALRKTLGDGRDGARYVSNVAGRGYCFVAPVTRSSTRQPVPI